MSVWEKCNHGETNEWYTPPEMFTALGVTFDLDPCSPGRGLSFVPAAEHYTIEDDGLRQPWRGLVWCNPPYGGEIGPWLLRLADHGEGISLVFARTETKWFQEAAHRASAVCFIAGRVRFYQGNKVAPGHAPPAPSVLMAYGDRAAQIVADADLGLTVQLTRRLAGVLDFGSAS